MADYDVTLKKLFLGEQDSTTGHYGKGFTLHSITCAIFPAGASFNFGTLGYHTVYTNTGFTQYNVTEGDVIEDSFERNHEVKAVKKWTSGDSLQFLELELEEKPEFPFLSGFFGFEDTEHGTEGYGFETGFENGVWAL